MRGNHPRQTGREDCYNTKSLVKFVKMLTGAQCKNPKLFLTYYVDDDLPTILDLMHSLLCTVAISAQCAYFKS